MSIYRPEFEAGLRLLAQVSEAMANSLLTSLVVFDQRVNVLSQFEQFFRDRAING